MGAFVSLLDPYPRNQPDFATNRLNALKIQDAQQQVAMNPARQQLLEKEATGRDLANQQAQMALDKQKRWMQAIDEAYSIPTSGNTTSQKATAPYNSQTSSTPDQLPGLDVLNPASAAGTGTIQASRAPINPPAAPTASQGAAGAPAFNDPFQRLIALGPKYRLDPNDLMALQAERNKMLQGLAAKTAEEQKVETGQTEAYAAQTQALLNIPETDMNGRQQYWQNVAMPALRRQGYGDELAGQTDLSNNALWAHLRVANFMKGNLTALKEQQATAAQVLGASTTKAEWDMHMEKLAGQVDPNVLARFGGWDENATNRARSLGMTASEQIKAPGDQAKSDNEVQQADAEKLRNAALQGRDTYVKVLNDLPHGRAVNFPDAPPKDQYDPKKFADTVNRRALNPEQEEGAKNREAQLANTEANQKATQDYRAQSLKIRQQIADRGVNQTFLLREADRHDVLLRDAEQARNAADQMNGIVNTPNGEQVTLKNGQKATMDAALRTSAARDYMAAKTKADNLEQQAKQMRQRYQWGEFGGQTPGQATPGANANTTATTTTNNNQPGGRIRVKLSDGRTGSVDAADFDPSSMTKLQQ
jgi:hypothetical protein